MELTSESDIEGDMIMTTLLKNSDNFVAPLFQSVHDGAERDEGGNARQDLPLGQQASSDNPNQGGADTSEKHPHFLRHMTTPRGTMLTATLYTGPP